jgi:hypothetical protein
VHDNRLEDCYRATDRVLLRKLARGTDHLFDQACELHGLTAARAPWPRSRAAQRRDSARVSSLSPLRDAPLG